jgi:lipopolysaccharide heptosyltransferase II
MSGKSFLIIQTAFLGDAILATALAENIYQQNKSNRISILVKKGNESLFKSHPFLKNVLVWDKTSDKNINLIKTIKLVRKHHFDVVVNIQRFFSTGLITALSGADVKIGFDKNPLSFLFTDVVKHTIGDGVHEVERNLRLIKAYTSISNSKPRLYPTEDNILKIKSIVTEPYVVLAPASVWKTKQLPESKWIELGNYCKSNYIIVFAGAGNDADLCYRIADKIGINNCIITAGKLNLLESAALIKEAKMTYVNDSGPLHIASAVSAPVTAFFCSTIPEFGFGPLSDNAKIIESNIKPDCKPCGIHGKKSCPLGHYNCGNEIQITADLIP